MHGCCVDFGWLATGLVTWRVWCCCRCAVALHYGRSVGVASVDTAAAVARAGSLPPPLVTLTQTRARHDQHCGNSSIYTLHHTAHAEMRVHLRASPFTIALSASPTIVQVHMSLGS